MPMRVIAKKRCRVMVEPPEKAERATLNPNLSTRLKPTFFRSGSWAVRVVAADRQIRALITVGNSERSGLALRLWQHHPAL